MRHAAEGCSATHVGTTLFAQGGQAFGHGGVAITHG